MTGFIAGRVSRARILVALVLTALLAGATTAIVLAVTSDPGPFTGCLATKKGDVYNVKIGSEPLAPCKTGDAQVTFSNAQGPQGEKGDPGADGQPGVLGFYELQQSSEQLGFFQAGTVTLNCLDGDVATGGGHSTAPFAPGTLIKSAPEGTTGWVVTWRNEIAGAITVSFLAHVICADLP